MVLRSQTRALQQLSEANSLVVATGGGAVVRNENWYIFFQLLFAFRGWKFYWTRFNFHLQRFPYMVWILDLIAGFYGCM